MCITAGIGAIIGAGVAYVPQVAANINRDGWSFQALTTDIDMGAVGRGALTGGLMGATAFVAAPVAVAAVGELVAGAGVAIGSTTVLAAGLEAQYAAGTMSNAVHGAAIVGLTEPTGYEATIAAGQRAATLQNALPDGSKGRTTMAVGIVEDGSGIRQTIVGTSEKNGYLRPEVRALVQENNWTVANGFSLHAEQNVVQFAQTNNYRVIAVGAGRAICPSCANCIENAGGIIASPMKMK